MFLTLNCMGVCVAKICEADPQVHFKDPTTHPPGFRGSPHKFDPTVMYALAHYLSVCVADRH
jgi:hypothetical protein